MSSSDRGFPRLLALLSLCVLGAACSQAPGSEHDPRPQRVVPAWGMNTEPVSVVIEGENFLPLVTQHIGGGEPVTVDARFEAFLGDVVLEDVTWVDERTLKARIPGGLAPGWHPLRVVGPQGGRVELPRAYVSSEVPLARLELEGSLERENVSVEERTWLRLTVGNVGGTAALAVTPVLSPVDGERVRILSEPGPADIAAGGSATFSWELEAAAPGAVHFSLEARGSEELTGVELRAPVDEVGPLRIRHRAVLTASFVPSSRVVNEGQAVTLTLSVANTGGPAVLGVVPGAPVVLGSLAELVSGPEPASADIPKGESRDFYWTYAARRAGTLAFRVDAAGHDDHSGVEVWAPEARSDDIAVQLPGALVARFSPMPTSVNVGQEFDAELEVLNLGDSAVLAVKLEATGVSGTGSVSLAPGSQPEPASVDIPGRGRAVFRARLVGTGAGSCILHAGARGVDQTSGVPVVAARADSSSVDVRRSATLTASLSAPSSVKPGSTFGVSLKVTNTGDTEALGVTPSPMESSGDVAELLSGPGSSPVELAGGASATFTWNYRAIKEGTVSFNAEASGQDGCTGAAVVTGRVSSGEVTILPEVEQLLLDPFGDGSPFAQVLGYGGRVYLGPNKSGTGGVSVDLDGLGGQSFGFSIHKDTSGNFSQNSSTPTPYPSIGRTGCKANTSECGPDNEDGRGFFFSGRVGTQEWLGLGGARSGGDLDYVYLGQDTAAPNTMSLRHLDLTDLLGSNTRGFSAALFFKDRLYLGFPDDGGSRPYLLSVWRLPTADPGYEAKKGLDAEDLQAQNMPGIGQGGTPQNRALMQMIDTLAEFNDRLYLANNGGCVRSTTTTPRSYGTASEDWAPCTPLLPAWSSRTSRTTAKTADLEPADKAVPQLAVFQGRLYLARNTTSTAGVRGPQLFVCSPERAGSAMDCDPEDWSLVAPNSTGDMLLTQFNDPENVSLSLLVATGSALYVGFDNAARGVVLLRASTAAPISRDDFTGAQGCSAEQFPSGCEGLAGNGLGVGATRIFDGKVLGASGSEAVYLTAGNGLGPAGLFRLRD